MSTAFARVFAELEQKGLLLLNDPDLPNVCSLVVGERVRGSWWSHPRAQDIFKVYDALEDHPDVLIIKLVSRKVTYAHRSLWPYILAVGSTREAWQMKDLTVAARKLLAAVDRGPVEPERVMSRSVSELEARMLVYSAQFHSASGAHVRWLESWRHWSERRKVSIGGLDCAGAKTALDQLLSSLNAQSDGKGCLPWQKKTVQGSLNVDS